MNILFCIGKNYREFPPLNYFAQRFARKYFGEIHQMIFCDSLEFDKNLNDMLFASLEFSLKCAENLLVLLPQAYFNQFLAFIKTMQNIESPREISTNITNEMLVSLEYETKGEARRIWLLDLQNLFANQTESQTSMQSFIERQFNKKKEAHHTIFLYLLGIDVASAQVLLGGIAKDFSIDLGALNSDSNLEILSATASDNESLQGFIKIVESTFANKIFPSFNLAQSVIALLDKHHLKITTAESCTGGLIAYQLTKESGASAVFDGGVISYANAIKETWLEVSNEHLAHYGAVSEAVVRDMLEGALRLSGADFALATSGIAGPSGGSQNKPIGMVFIGAKDRRGTEIIEQLHFKGDRNYIQEQATIYAYLLFLKIFYQAIDF